MNFGMHEVAELHEWMMYKNNCVSKSSMMLNMVQDNQLRSLLQKDVANSKNAVQQLQTFLITPE